MPFTIYPYGRFPVPDFTAGNAGAFFKRSQAFFLGFWLLIALLVLSREQVHAEWMLVSGDDAAGLAVYVDPGTIRQKGNLAKMWQLYDYKTVQRVAGDSLLSMKRFNEYDCTEARTRTLGYTWFSGHMGSGNVVYSTTEVQPWELVVSRSINHTLWKTACGKK
ncbi:MAG TPA: surface-adhesin E family protein [Nitrospiraceae bacterium]|nr:surface-adhesin E family protein [Nitrospiraceae bacterium]